MKQTVTRNDEQKYGNFLTIIKIYGEKKLCSKSFQSKRVKYEEVFKYEFWISLFSLISIFHSPYLHLVFYLTKTAIFK